ncbi:MAG: hypothetical protein KDC45_07040 [Bacteroidetes bacterium]|nr:hypothetical protein [Bacteroidota bacterium]
MFTKILMTGSAVFLIGTGLAFSFLPREIQSLLQEGTQGEIAWLLQILGALLLGFGMLNWMARGNLMGGIYSRPVAMGNFLHFSIGAVTLLKKSGSTDGFLIAITLVYSLLAFSFGMVLFGNPLKWN